MLATAAGIAATAPIASRLTKLALADGGHADLESALQWEALAQPVTLATADLQEGIRAAREKRAAGLHRPLSGRCAAKRPAACDACLPLASVVDGPGASSGPSQEASAVGGPPVDNLWTNLWNSAGRPVDNRPRPRDEPVEDTPGRGDVRCP